MMDFLFILLPTPIIFPPMIVVGSAVAMSCGVDKASPFASFGSMLPGVDEEFTSPLAPLFAPEFPKEEPPNEEPPNEELLEEEELPNEDAPNDEFPPEDPPKEELPNDDCEGLF